MSKRNKLLKFEEMAMLPNVVECPDPTNPVLHTEHKPIKNLKGEWANSFFKNEYDITLELACGRGEYTLGMARMESDKNFLGVDVKGARIWRGAKTAIEEKLVNVGFLRTRIEVLDHFFGGNEVSEIWITFPDPFARKESRRLTYVRFLDMYKKIFTHDGILHLKTDDTEYYEYSLMSISNHPNYEIIYSNDDIYASELLIPQLELKTYYEKQHLRNNKTIKYIQSRVIINNEK